MKQTDKQESLARQFSMKQQQLYSETEKVLDICNEISQLEERAQTDPEAARKLALLGDYNAAMRRFCERIKGVTASIRKLNASEKQAQRKQETKIGLHHFNTNIA